MPALHRPRMSAGLLLIGVLAAAFTLGWGWWMWTAAGGAGPHPQIISYAVRPDNSISVTFEVTGAGDRAAICRIRALDETHAVVGATEVTVPAGVTRMSYRLPATARPTAADVGDCRLTT